MNYQSNIPDYDGVEDALASCGIDLDPAEYHGALCGYLCASSYLDPAQWSTSVLPQMGDDVAANSVAAERLVGFLNTSDSLLAQLHQITEDQLEDYDCGFELLLLDDDERLSWRTEVLAHWCEGFLFGLTAGGLTDLDGLSGELNELLGDFVEISRVEHKADEESNIDETAFVEVSEYVRLGVLAFWAELRSKRAPHRAVTIH